eukprot:3236001-Amphidinium_carterae.1
MQSQSSLAIAFVKGASAFSLTGHFYSHLQSMSRSSGDVIARCVARAAAPSDYAANTLKLVVRSSCADRHPTNVQGERLLLAKRAPFT